MPAARLPYESADADLVLKVRPIQSEPAVCVVGFSFEWKWPRKHPTAHQFIDISTVTTCNDLRPGDGIVTVRLLCPYEHDRVCGRRSETAHSNNPLGSLLQVQPKLSKVRCTTIRHRSSKLIA